MLRRRRSTVVLICCIFLVAVMFYALKIDNRDLVNFKTASTISENVLELNDAENKLHEDLMKKYNETVANEKIDEDPFHTANSNDVDFRHFKIDFSETKYKPEDLIPIVEKLNERQITYNYEKFDLEPHQVQAVIIVQVHKRIEYLAELFDALQHAKGIEKVILVVSHDFYSDKINELIRRIHFCQMIQIFFPYSSQLYPDKFPGQSPEDCDRDIKKSEAMKMGCQNAETPDKYGHYREAHITMTKHHWWWKINTVLDQLDATKGFHGPFLFLEEDHYVSPSFLDALLQLDNIKKTDSRCKNSCDILTLGNYNGDFNYKSDGQKAFLGTWISSQHNMGMALYRDTWEKIKKCSEMFCTYDDYNWDWSLMRLSQACFQNMMNVIVYGVPRVFHVGDCGLHHKENCANAKETLNHVKLKLKQQKDYLYQNAVLLKDKTGNIGITPNGGWGDPRDHDLCRSFVHNNKEGLL